MSQFFEVAKRVITTLLLNEVSEKKIAKFETKFPKFSPKIAPKFAPKFVPKFIVLSWQVEKKSSPKFHQIFPIGNFKFQIEFQIKFHQTFHKHTSAGWAALKESTGNIAATRLLVNPYGPEIQTELC